MGPAIKSCSTTCHGGVFGQILDSSEAHFRTLNLGGKAAHSTVLHIGLVTCAIEADTAWATGDPLFLSSPATATETEGAPHKSSMVSYQQPWRDLELEF